MDNSLVQEKLREWTRGLDAREARIAVFTRIRDMPYEIIAELKDPYEGPVKTLEAGRGSCTAKHFLLGAMLQLMELPVQYVTYPFYWGDPDIAYPPEVKMLAERAPLEYHLANKAFIDGKWVLVDATWDPAVAKAGFPVNHDWDGRSDTVNAVKPLREVVHDGAVERAQYTDEVKAAYSGEEALVLDEFVAAFNRWLRELRGEG